MQRGCLWCLLCVLCGRAGFLLCLWVGVNKPATIPRSWLRRLSRASLCRVGGAPPQAFRLCRGSLPRVRTGQILGLPLGRCLCGCCIREAVTALGAGNIISPFPRGVFPTEPDTGVAEDSATRAALVAGISGQHGPEAVPAPGAFSRQYEVGDGAVGPPPVGRVGRALCRLGGRRAQGGARTGVPGWLSRGNHFHRR